MHSPALLVRCLLALVLAVPLTSARAQTVWEMATEYPASAMPGEGVATFARLVGEKSGGRLTVNASFDATKGKSAEILAAVREGRLQAGDAFAGALGTLDPVFGLSSLPFLTPSLEAAKTLAAQARTAYAETLARHGQRLLYTTPWPPTGLWAKRAVLTPDDMRQLSVRTYDDTSTAVLQAVGAKAVNLSFADAMPKLREGAVDAVLSSGDGGAGRRLWDFLPHFTAINYAIPLSLATVSNAAFAALPADLQGTIEAAAAETETRQWSAIGARLEQNYARMRANNVTIHTEIGAELRAALRQAAAGAIDDWRRKAGPAGAAVLDAVPAR
jgi:TRAP-type C4-dicarboxylate transport system substrate-binding protein